MSSVIELHDSVVTGSDVSDGNAIIRFSPAYLHRVKKAAGLETGDVFTLDLDIVLGSATINSRFTEIPSELQGGSIAVAGETFDNCIPYPLSSNESISAKLTDYYGREIQITAQSISISAASPETYVESFPINNDE